MSLISRTSFVGFLLAALAATACDKVPLLAPTNTTIRLTAGLGVLPVAGSTEIVAVVIESAGTPVQNGTVVTFTSSLGTVEPREARTQNGQVSVRFIAGSQSGSAKVGAFSGGSKSEDLEIFVGAAAAGAVTLRSEAAFVPSTGGTTGILAQVIDKGGNPLRGVPVGFSATTGLLSASTALTNDAGEARVELTTNTTSDVTATVGGSTTALTAKTTVTARDLPAIAVAATSSLGGSNTTETGLPIIFTLTPPANAGVRSARIDYGDGQSDNLGAVPAPISRSHIYTRPGTYLVNVTATDAFGNTGTTTLAIVVNERGTVGVTVQVLSNISGLVTFSVSTSGTISGSIRTYDWDFGDGTGTTTTGPQTSHRYTAAGTYIVRVSVRTTTGQEGYGEATIRF
jgi:PKD repeat protein